MLRRAFSLCAVLGFASAAHAGVIVTLVPSDPAAGVGQPYGLNEVVHVSVLARLDAAIPAPAPGNPNARLRLARFDFADTSPELTLTPIVTHTDAFESSAVTGKIGFWDFSTTGACSGDPGACGTGHFIEAQLLLDQPSMPDAPTIVYTGLGSSSANQIALSPTADKTIAQFEITMPSVAGDGTFLLDVLNADEEDINRGAEFQHGFGNANDPSRSYRASAGTINYAPGTPSGGLSFAVVPEPATLAMLGLGGLAAAFRRRRSA